MNTSHADIFGSRKVAKGEGLVSNLNHLGYAGCYNFAVSLCPLPRRRRGGAFCISILASRLFLHEHVSCGQFWFTQSRKGQRPGK